MREKADQLQAILNGKIAEFKPIDSELFYRYEVKRGLRDISGRGVLAGLTEIGEVHSYILDENEMVPVPGKLYYRGYDVDALVDGFVSDNRFGFEETAYLLLFGSLPAEKELEAFKTILSIYREGLPEGFVRDMMMKAPGRNMMNMLARSVLSLYSYDEDGDNTDLSNVLRQCLQLIAYFPMLAVYGYQAFTHFYQQQSFIIHKPNPELTTAENILYMLRQDSRYTRLEAELLDLALVLHAEHGGGNNSSFVTHVVTSTGTDTYSAIAAAMGALKGPRHGGANIKVIQMFEDIKENIHNWEDEDEIARYLARMLNKEVFDQSGLIYGIGHAVYAISDPRALQLKKQAQKLAIQKGLEAEFNLYARIEVLAPQVIAKVRRMYKGVSANVDFYSGFVYQMLEIPPELYTPLFAIARIVGWSAHRIEEIVNNGKIIRPAYKSIARKKDYRSLSERTVSDAIPAVPEILP